MSEFENPMLLEISRDDRMILRHFATKVKNFGLVITQNDEGKVSKIILTMSILNFKLKSYFIHSYRLN